MLLRPSAVALATLAVSAAGIAGCSVRRADTFDGVSALVRERSDQVVEWSADSAGDEALSSRVQPLLDEPLGVDDAVRIGLLSNRSLQAAFEELGVARADMIQAGLMENPILFGSHRHSNRAAAAANTEFGISQSLLSLFTIAGRRKLAASELEEARLRATDRVIGLEADLRAAYYALQGDIQTAEMLGAILETLDAAREFSGRQRAAGNISELDNATQQALHEDVRISLAREQQGVIGRREALQRLMGLSGSRMNWRVLPRLPDIPESDPPLEGLEALALTRRADLLARRQEIETLGHALRVTVRWRWTPLIELGYDTERDTDGERVSGPNLAIQLPIFDTGKARVARLRSLLRRSENEMSALAVGIASDVREARSRMLAQREIAESYRTRIIPLREKIVRESQLFQNYMLIGVFQLLQARRDEMEAYRGYIASVRDYWIARCELERASGGRLEASSRTDERNP